MTRYFKMQALRKAFKEAGLYTGSNLIYFTIKIRRLEAKGVLKVNRDVTSGHRIFTETQIKQIVRAFSPRGRGYWFIEERKK